MSLRCQTSARNFLWLPVLYCESVADAGEADQAHRAHRAHQAHEAAKLSPPAAGMSIVFVGDIMLDGGPGHAVSTGRDPFAACSELLADAD